MWYRFHLKNACWRKYQEEAERNAWGLIVTSDELKDG
jgi:hypothetical protein